MHRVTIASPPHHRRTCVCVGQVQIFSEEQHLKAFPSVSSGSKLFRDAQQIEYSVLNDGARNIVWMGVSQCCCSFVPDCMLLLFCFNPPGHKVANHTTLVPSLRPSLVVVVKGAGPPPNAPPPPKPLLMSLLLCLHRVAGIRRRLVQDC